MSTDLTAVHERLVREVADSYAQQGFHVQIEPSSEDLPYFLRGLQQPDLLVTTSGGEHITVEVKMRGRQRGADYWKRLKTVMEEHPGWRFELVVNNKREQELFTAALPLLTHDEIEARLQTGRQIADAGLLDSALVVVWATLEALLRDMALTDRLELLDEAPAAVFTLLYTDGSLDREDYDALRYILPIRNQVAHGHFSPGLNREVVDQAIGVARRLIKQLSRSSRRKAQKSAPKEQPV